jgi:hypothetical protein
MDPDYYQIMRQLEEMARKQRIATILAALSTRFSPADALTQAESLEAELSERDDKRFGSY